MPTIIMVQAIVKFHAHGGLMRFELTEPVHDGEPIKTTYDRALRNCWNMAIKFYTPPRWWQFWRWADNRPPKEFFDGR